MCIDVLVAVWGGEGKWKNWSDALKIILCFFLFQWSKTVVKPDVWSRKSELGVAGYKGMA